MTEYDVEDREDLAPLIYEKLHKDDPVGKEAQEQKLVETADAIWKTSRKFDLDTAGKKTNFDFLIEEGVVRKSLESDSLLYVEGARF